MWAELVPLFAGVDRTLIADERTEVTITAGRGAGRRTIQDSDVKSLLEGVFLRGVVKDIDIYFEVTTMEPDAPYTQSLLISFSRGDTTLVQLEGTKDWVHQAKSKVDSFLEQRQNSNAKYRPVAFLAALLPAATMIGYPFYTFLVENSVYQFPATALLAAAMGLLISGGILWFVFYGLYPVSIFNLGPRTHPPLLYRLAREIIAGVVIALIVSAVIAVAFLFKP